MRYCIHCGGSNADDALFCHVCGRRLGEAASGPKQTQPARRRMSYWMSGLLVLLALAVITAAVWLLTANLGKEPEAEAELPEFSWQTPEAEESPTFGWGTEEPMPTTELQPEPTPAPTPVPTLAPTPAPTAEPDPGFHTDELETLRWEGGLYDYTRGNGGEKPSALIEEDGLYLMADAAIPDRILLMLHTETELFRAVLDEDGSALLRTSSGEYLAAQLYPAENGAIPAVLTSQSDGSRYTFLLMPAEPEEEEENLIMGRILPEANIRYYSRQEILMAVQPWVDAGYTLSEALRLARNELYANHGNIFKDETLNEYFYEERGDVFFRSPGLSAEMIADLFNEYEGKNVSLIKDIEEEFE